MSFIEKLFSRAVHPLYAPVAGRAVAVTEVPDPAFSRGMLGKGVAIIPSDGGIYAPCDATVDVVFTTGHAVSLVADCGAEILIHVGLGAAAHDSRFFTAHVRSGQKVTVEITLAAKPQTASTAPTTPRRMVPFRSVRST